MKIGVDGAESSAPFTIAPPGHRLHPSVTLGVVRLQVADLARSISYYEEVIGLRTMSRDASHSVLGVAADQTPLVELHHRVVAAPVPARGRLGLYHFAILLPDRAALGRFISHLAALGARAGMADHLVSEAVYLNDPDGLGIEVYADRPRAGWKVVDGALAMATDPLDAADLVRAAGGDTWTGAPSGTRIGHVHLHVGDLDDAARFYHRTRKSGARISRCTLHVRGRLSPPPRYEHVGRGRTPRARE